MANAVQASLLAKGRAVLGPTPWSGLISGGTTALSGGRARDAGLSISSSSRLASRCLAKIESDPPEATLSQAARAPLTDRTTRLGQTAASLVLHRRRGVLGSAIPDEQQLILPSSTAILSSSQRENPRDLMIKGSRLTLSTRSQIS